MSYVFIDEKTIMNARTYVPLMEKARYLDDVSNYCFEKLEIHADRDGENVAIPPMYKENTLLKSRYMMGALAKLYLNIAFDPVEGTEFLMSADDYDRWAGSHVLNQIERMKQKGGEVKDRIFDLLQDYKDLEKRLNAEVYSLCNVMNDPCHRLMLMLESQTTPESMMQAAEELKGVKEELEKYKAERKG